MFDTSSYAVTSIAIYPNSSDSWDVVSPFNETINGAQEGFVFSTSTVNNASGLLKLLTGRLVDVGKRNNMINFLAKTNLKQSTAVATKGIGGMTKLKDFSFSLTKENMSRTDIINTFGRTIVCFLSNSTGVEDPDSGLSKIVFKGRIESAKRENVKVVTFNVKGLFDSVNPLVAGPIVQTVDGSQEHETLIFGDTSDAYLPISKKEDDEGNITLQFSQSDDFIIKDLFVKAGTDDDPLYLPINTLWDIVDNEVIFEDRSATVVSLNQNLTTDNQVERVEVSGNVYEIGFKIDGVLFGGVPEDYLVVDALYNYCTLSGFFVLDTTYTQKFRYKRSEVIVDDTIYWFECGWEFIYGYMRKLIDTNDGTYVSAIQLALGVYAGIDYCITGKVAALEKEIDALGATTITGSLEDYSTNELKNFIEEFDYQGFKAFQQIPSDPVVIRVDDEEMLLLYTEKNTGAPAYETAPGSPVNSYIWVMRGWNNTTIAAHTSGANIELLTSPNKEIIYTLDKKLTSLTTFSPSRDFICSSVQEFLAGTKDLIVHSLAGLSPRANEHDPAGFMGLNWQLPDLKGDLFRLSMIGESSSAIYSGHDLSAITYIECSTNLALHTVVDGTEDNQDTLLHARRAYGERLGVTKFRDRYAMSKYLKNSPGADVTISGKYELLLKRAWGLDRGQSGSQASMFIYNHGNMPIASYDELKETSMYITFNTATTQGIRSVFTMSLPTLKVSMKAKLEDVDIVASVIPRSIFDTPDDTYSTVGTNCKIAWHPNYVYAEKDQLMVSDDDDICFGRIYINPTGSFGVLLATPETPDYTGYLAKHVVEGNDLGKIYPTENLKESLVISSGLTFTLRSSDFDSGLLDAGKTFLENLNSYIWVDQDNNRLLLARKNETDEGNPVTIIENLIDTYYSSATKDTTAFAIAKAKRTDWYARLMVKDEKTLASLIDLIAKNHGLLVHENNEGKFSVVSLEPPAEEDVTLDISDSIIAYKGDQLSYVEDFTDLDYIITEMDVYFNFYVGKYRNIIESGDLSTQDEFTIASQFNEDTTKVNLQLESVFDQGTANKCAEVKMAYHQVPTRLIRVRATLAVADIPLGTWVTCSSTKIEEVSGKIYLIIGNSTIPPFKGRTTYCELYMFEFDWDELVLQIQEVPNQSTNENYTETIDNVEQINEVPDA